MTERQTLYNLYAAYEDPDCWPTFNHLGTFLTKEQARLNYIKDRPEDEAQIYEGSREDCDYHGDLQFPGTTFGTSPKCFGVIEVVYLSGHDSKDRELQMRRKSDDKSEEPCYGIRVTHVCWGAIYGGPDLVGSKDEIESVCALWNKDLCYGHPDQHTTYEVVLYDGCDPADRVTVEEFLVRETKEQK